MSIDTDRKNMTMMSARSIAAEIYENTKYDILYGIIKPGQRLNEMEIAKASQASRTPVREALFRL
jgi:DNA-binding GntR family transcriptional regulator